jgi:pSer/pThr/pTyr-binding forkhead associated (FHA) protein
VLADGEKIVGAPVVDIAASGSVPVKVRTCARCHGHCLAGTRFCKFCGALLDEGPTLAVQSPRAQRALVKEAALATDEHDAGAAVEPALQADPEPKRVPTADPAQIAEPQPLAPRDGDARPALAEPVPARVARVKDVGARILPDLHPIRSAASVAEKPGARADVSELAGAPIPPKPVAPTVARAPSNGVAQARTDGAEERPAAGRSKGGRLVVIVEDGSEGKSFSLADGQLDIGRTEGDIVLEDDPYVSPRHARLRRAETSWIVRDLDSVNRVYVRLRKPQPLRDGDLLLLGLEVLQFQTVSDGERGHGHAIQHGTFVFGSPAARGSFARARLCQRTVEGVIRDVYHLFRDETIIGREVGDIVFTADPFLSRRHAAIRRNPVSSEFSLVDLESSNGTYIAIRGEVAVGDDDYLRIGQHLFRVDLG